MAVRVFDPNTPIPFGLKDAVLDDRELTELPEPDADIDPQTETLLDDDSQLDEDEVDDELGVPGSFTIVSQTVRTSPDGRQVVDIVIDVEEVDGAENYQVHVTKT